MRFKLILSTITLAFLLSNCKGKQSEAATIPTHIPQNKTQNRVVDLAHLFSSNQRDSLVHKLLNYEIKSSNQMAILTIDSLPEHTTIQNFGTEVGNSWGVGTKEKDNGLLITIARYDRQVAISTGTGTQQTISDYDANSIINRIMIPQFKTNNYYKGVDKAIDSLIQLWD